MSRHSLTPEVTSLRRLFRRLNEVASLRGNPLTVQLFGGPNHEVLDAGAIHQRVRSTVMAALESITPPPDDSSRSAQYARRLRAIVERCDLHGELHSVVARDLGICVRQLYRDRHEALARLVEVLRKMGTVREPQVTSVPQSIGDVELQLNLVARLESVGRFRDARDVLESLANQPLPPAHRGLVTHRLVEALCDAGSIVEGRAVLGSAKRELEKAECSESELRIIRSEMLAAEAALALRAAKVSSAIDSAERGLALIRSHHGSDPKRARSLAVELSILLRYALCVAGAFDRAIRTIESAKAFVDEHLDAEIATSLHFNSCYAHLLRPGELNLALQENSEAWEIARHRGHARHEAIALGNFSMIHFLSGNYADAMQYGQKALLVCELVASPTELAHLLVNIARVAIASGNTTHALKLLVRAKQQVAANDRLCGMIEVVESEAFTANGQFDAAEATARRARRVFENCGDHRQLAITLCAEARAHAGLAKKRSAISVIHGAIDIAESYGSAYSLSQVYRASAEITGNKRHAKYAAGIDSMQRV